MRRRVVTRWLPIMIFVSFLMSVAMSFDGEISQIDGANSNGPGLIVFTIYTIKTAKKQKIHVGDVIEDEDPV